MAVLFDDESSEFYTFLTAPATAEPITMACWFYIDETPDNDYCIMQLQDDGTDSNYFRMNLGNDAAPETWPVSCFSSGLNGSSTDSDRANSTTQASQNVWHHACAIWAAVDDRRAFIDGGSKGTQTDTLDQPANIDSIDIGREGDSSAGDYFSGGLFWPALWDVALTDAEVAILASGVPPWKVRPESLQFFVPLYSAGTPRDWISGTAATTTGGSPATTEGPCVQLDSGIIVPYNLAAGSVTITIPTGPWR